MSGASPVAAGATTPGSGGGGGAGSAGSAGTAVMIDDSAGSDSASGTGSTGGGLKRRKRQRQPEKWKRNNYTRKVLKDKGACSCMRKCFDLIPESERTRIKTEFATLSKAKQDGMTATTHIRCLQLVCLICSHGMVLSCAVQRIY